MASLGTCIPMVQPSLNPRLLPAKIREALSTILLKHVNNISDGFFPWNYIVRKLAHLSVSGVLAVLAWKAIYPYRFA
jgi:hypothetical protein